YDAGGWQRRIRLRHDLQYRKLDIVITDDCTGTYQHGKIILSVRVLHAWIDQCRGIYDPVRRKHLVEAAHCNGEAVAMVDNFLDQRTLDQCKSACPHRRAGFVLRRCDHRDRQTLVTAEGAGFYRSDLDLAPGSRLY